MWNRTISKDPTPPGQMGHGACVNITAEEPSLPIVMLGEILAFRRADSSTPAVPPNKINPASRSSFGMYSVHLSTFKRTIRFQENKTNIQWVTQPKWEKKKKTLSWTFSSMRHEQLAFTSQLFPALTDWHFFPSSENFTSYSKELYLLLHLLFPISKATTILLSGRRKSELWVKWHLWEGKWLGMKDYCILKDNCNQFTWLAEEKNTMLNSRQEF